LLAEGFPAPKKILGQIPKRHALECQIGNDESFKLNAQPKSQPSLSHLREKVPYREKIRLGKLMCLRCITCESVLHYNVRETSQNECEQANLAFMGDFLKNPGGAMSDLRRQQIPA